MSMQSNQNLMSENASVDMDMLAFEQALRNVTEEDIKNYMEKNDDLTPLTIMCSQCM